MPSEKRVVRCLCSPADVVLIRIRHCGNLVRFGGVCERCGRGIDLLIEKRPGNEVRRA